MKYVPPQIDPRIRLGELTPFKWIDPRDRLAKWMFNSARAGHMRTFRSLGPIMIFQYGEWSRPAQGELK